MVTLLCTTATKSYLLTWWLPQLPSKNKTCYFNYTNPCSLPNITQEKWISMLLKFLSVPPLLAHSTFTMYKVSTHLVTFQFWKWNHLLCSLRTLIPITFTKQNKKPTNLNFLNVNITKHTHIILLILSSFPLSLFLITMFLHVVDWDNYPNQMCDVWLNNNNNIPFLSYKRCWVLNAFVH